MRALARPAAIDASFAPVAPAPGTLVPVRGWSGSPDALHCN